MTSLLSVNESTPDRAIRALVGLAAFVAAAFWTTGAMTVVAVIAGAIMLVTSILGFCPIYRMIGVSTAGRPSGAAHEA